MFQSCFSNIAISRPIPTTNDDFTYTHTYTCDDTNKPDETYSRVRVSTDHYSRVSVMMASYYGGFNALV